MIIDSHSHVYHPIEKMINMMDREQIDRTVLFITTVHPELYSNYEGFRGEICKLQKIVRGEVNMMETRINAMSELKTMINKFPDRFIGFGYCPVGMNESDTAQWVENYIVKSVFKGIGEITLGEGQVGLTETLFKVLSAYPHQYPLWFHTFHPLSWRDIYEIICLARKYPQVDVILGHGGGAFWLETIEEIRDDSNVYFDISASFQLYSLKIAAELISDRVLFGVDMPYGSPSMMKQLVIESVPDLAKREQILSGNIQRLMSL